MLDSGVRHVALPKDVRVMPRESPTLGTKEPHQVDIQSASHSNSIVPHVGIVVQPRGLRSTARFAAVSFAAVESSGSVIGPSHGLKRQSQALKRYIAAKYIEAIHECLPWNQFRVSLLGMQLPDSSRSVGRVKPY